MVNYDLAIIGISANAFKLVSRAVRDCARIAWIWDCQASDPYLNISEVHHVLQQLISSLNNQVSSESLCSFAKWNAPTKSLQYRTIRSVTNNLFYKSFRSPFAIAMTNCNILSDSIDKHQ